MIEEGYRHDPEEGDDAPLAPIVEITLRHRNRNFICRALVDSGSAFSTITEDARQALSPKKSGDRYLAGATDKEGDDYPMYKVDALYFAGVEYTQFELTHLGTATGLALIGRDILNRHTALMDGPNQRLTID
jgi:hypothetical protein